MSKYAIDPELVPGLAQWPALDRTDPLAARRAVAERTAVVAPYIPPIPLLIEDLRVPGPPRESDVPVRIFRPRDADDPLPLVLWIHGGGFTLGSIDLDANAAAQIAAECQAIVVSVEYRLAPENPYPAAAEDCFAALCWLSAHAAQFGGDNTRLAVSGESAGGGLAAAICLLSRDRSGPSIMHQFLFIPELDDRLDTPSMLAYTDTPVWHRKNAILSWSQYLGDLMGTERVPIYAAPARAKDHSRLPNAYIVVCEFDPLRDEGIDYAMALMRAGTSVELHLYPGTFHGSVLDTTAAVSRRMIADKIGSFRRILA